MSTKNLSYSSGGKLELFLLISLAIHILFGWTVVQIGGVYRLFSGAITSEEIRPVVVDVIELPPWLKGNGKAQQSITRFADRTVTVDKETIAEQGPATTARPGAPAALSLKPAAKPRAGETKGGAAKGDGPSTVQSGKVEIKGSGEPARTLKTDNTLSRPQPWSAQGLGLSPSEIPGAPTEGTGRGSMEPNLFLTEAQIAALTKRYETETPVAERGKTLQLNTAELKYRSYLLNMKTRIELYWEYPILAVRNGWQGNLQINFSIQEDGKVGEIKTANSSGYPVLDDSARTALRLAAPFPPFPEDFEIEEIKINGRFEYKLYSAPPDQLR